MLSLSLFPVGKFAHNLVHELGHAVGMNHDYNSGEWRGSWTLVVHEISQDLIECFEYWRLITESVLDISQLDKHRLGQPAR